MGNFGDVLPSVIQWSFVLIREYVSDCHLTGSANNNVACG